MKLEELVKHIGYTEIKGGLSVEVTAIAFDSRKVSAGTLFIAQRGLHSDGHLFIETALGSGAVAVVCEEIPAKTAANITYIKVNNSFEATGLIAAAYYGFPSGKIKVVGVTGTNGKTSIATLLYRLFRKLGYKAGLISTISYTINDVEEPARFTTPDPLKVQELMADMVSSGCGFCFMEVS